MSALDRRQRRRVGRRRHLGLRTYRAERPKMVIAGGEIVSYKVGRARGVYRYRIGRARDPRRVRVTEIGKEIRSAKTVETVKLLEDILNNERGFLGEDAYRKLSLLAAKRMNKVGPKEKTLDLGLGKVGFRSEGKVL